MNKAFSLTFADSQGEGLRAELRFEKADGRTVITVAMTVPNQLGTMTVAQAQAELLRMAIADLEQERASLLSIPRASS